jgi:GTP cyclohydrolase I
MIANDNKIKTLEEKENMINKISEKFYDILKIMDFDVELDQQIVDTPKRIAKMWINDLFKGCYEEEPKLTFFNNERNIDDIVFLGPIDVKSNCSHHFILFTGKCFIAYIPDRKIVGVSKLARIVKWFMRRPQIQEELVKQIADYIYDKLEPKGCAVFLEAQHHCMTSRGVQEPDSWMISSAVRGDFKTNQVLEDKFMQIINMRKK